MQIWCGRGGAKAKWGLRIEAKWGRWAGPMEIAQVKAMPNMGKGGVAKPDIGKLSKKCFGHIRQSRWG